jgi:hypothetical protein
MAAQNSAMAAQNSAMAAQNSAMAAQNSAMAAQNSAMAAQNSAVAAQSCFSVILRVERGWFADQGVAEEGFMPFTAIPCLFWADLF